VLAWLFARSTGRAFLLRIEDLDAGRVRPGLAEQQVADLTALGLDFDGVPTVQSQRTAAYAAALAQIADRTYECFCTRREIAEAASAPHGYAGRYPGTCRRLSAAERAERRRTRTPALRLRADGASQTVHDLLHGTVTGQADDFVVRRNDGVAAYNLAVVVDDAESGVDQVVRGDDLLPSAVDQAYLAGLLGHPVPVYAHVPLAVNVQGRRLAKRDGAVTLSDLAAHGVTPVEVLGLIAESLGWPAPGRPAELLPRFDPARLPRNPWVVHPASALESQP
jgi:glutamyl-tRNA synthetase